MAKTNDRIGAQPTKEGTELVRRQYGRGDSVAGLVIRKRSEYGYPDRSVIGMERFVFVPSSLQIVLEKDEFFDEGNIWRAASLSFGRYEVFYNQQSLGVVANINEAQKQITRRIAKETGRYVDIGPIRPGD